MRDPGKRNLLPYKEVAREQSDVALMTMLGTLGLLVHQAFQLGNKAFVTLLVIRLIRKHDLAFAIQGHPIIRVGKVFRSQPEIERVIGHLLQGEVGGYGWRARPERLGVKLSYKRDVAHRIPPILRAEVKIVDRKGLLKDGGVGAL